MVCPRQIYRQVRDVPRDHLGGPASVVPTTAAARSGAVVLTLTFDYGQRSAKREAKAARAVARELGLEWKLVRLTWLAKLLPPAMRTGGKLNESLLVTYTDPLQAQLDLPFAVQMVRHGKAPSPLPERIEKLGEVKGLMKNVKETI